MKTVMEQLVEIQDKLDALKSQTQQETEVKGQEMAFTFTQDALVTFATHLVERTIDNCKEAVTNTNLDVDGLVDLSMGCGYQIDVELDADAIIRSVQDEIDESIDTDADSVNSEVMSILDDMGIKS
jgi:phosphoketolase